MGARGYLAQSEKAIQHLFKGLNAYDSIQLPSIMDFVDETGLVKMTKAEDEVFLRAYEEYFDLDFARASLAGSILQVAYMGLKKYSSVTGISPRRSELDVKAGTTAAAFCVGKDVKGIPQGLLIYAGQIQYNHWEERELSNTVARRVFRELVVAYHDNHHFDMAYVLGYPRPRPVSHYIVRLELGWSTYDEYRADMSSMLLNEK